MAERKTQVEVEREVEEKTNKEYTVIGKYINNHTKVLIRHNSTVCNNYEWEVVVKDLLRGKNSCPICARIIRSHKFRKTHEEFVREVEEKYKGEYTVLSEYEKSTIKVLVKHNSEKCNNHEWKITPNSLLRGNGCPKCYAISMRKTNEEFLKEVKTKFKDEYSILSDYVDSKTKIKVRHNCGKCNNYAWITTPEVFLKSKGCPECYGRKKKTQEEFEKEVKEKYGNELTILSKYVNSETKILVRHNCKRCNNHEWEITPNNLYKGRGCPVCANKKAVLGINTIYDTDSWMRNWISLENAKKYTHGSKKKILMKCPECGEEKEIEIAYLYRHKNIGCSCYSGGASYPERLLKSILEQCKINAETQYSPKWIKPKRYDFYIPLLDMIIETHGEQHYRKTFENLSGKTLEEEQKNDRFKKEVALKNGVKHYIELDCRKSNLDYIKNSIINSELNNLINLSNADWIRCAELANKNIVKEVCNYWNNKKEENETTSDVGKIFKLNRRTICDYLKRGTKLGWTNYKPREELEKIRKANFEKFKYACRGKMVLMSRNGELIGIFKSASYLAEYSQKIIGIKLTRSKVYASCKGEIKQYKGYQFKYI